MADTTEHKLGGAAAQRYYHDEQDGSYSEAQAARLRLWDGSSWVRGKADSNGYLQVTFPSKTILNAKIDTASSGDNTIVAADASNKIKVLSYVLVAGGTVSVTWKSGATTKSGAMPLVANTGASVAGTENAPVLETAVNSALVLALSGAVQVSGHISYIKESS